VPEPDPRASERRAAAVPRGLIGLVAASLTIALLYFGRDLLVPFALAVLVSFVLDPLVARLRRWRLPRVLAVALVMLCTVAVVGATSVFVGSQVIELGHDLPTYQKTIRGKLRDLRQHLSGRGLFEDASRMMDVVGTEIKATQRAIDGSARAPHPAPTRVQIDPTPLSPLQAIGEMLSPVLKPLAEAGVVLVFVLFILLERNDLRDRFLRLVGGDLHRMTDAMNEAAHRVSRYLTMQLLVNSAYALPMTLGLWLIGVPGALLWGVMAGALRFVPYVGPVIAAAFPLTMAFAVDPGWHMLLWTLLLIVSLELIINNLVEPWLYGASTGLAPVAVLVSAALWTALWGPIGLILATPLTVCLVVMGRHLPALGFLDILFGRGDVFDGPTRLYQRLLAGDVEEVCELADQQVQQSSLQSFYDDTAVAALRLAADDHARVANVEHRHRVAGGMAALISELRESHPVAAPDAAPQVLCIGARWEADTMAADMLAHALSTDGLAAQLLPPAAVSAERLAALPLQGVQVVCLSYFSRQPETHARYVCRRLRRLRPDLHIVLVLWNAPAALLAADAIGALGADAVANSLVEATLRVKTWLAPSGVCASPLPVAADNDAARLQALADSGALAPAMRAAFDRTAQRVSDIFDTPLALVYLADDTRQVWHGASGADDAASLYEAAHESALCSQVVASEAPLLVPDIERDPRFATDPSLQSDGLRFFAGAPLRVAAGLAVGALCIVDRRPRSLTAREMRLLQAMADDLMKSMATSARAAPASAADAADASPATASPAATEPAVDGAPGAAAPDVSLPFGTAAA